MKISGKTRLLGLIGNPVEHTLSPVIHNTIAGQLGGEYAKTAYVPFHVEHGDLDTAVKGAYALNVLGMNVTVPYKQEVMESLVSVDDMARSIGAVNTLVRVDGGYRGYNTDAEGFVRELKWFQVEIRDKNVVMLGAGGAARAVAFSLMKEGAAKIIILNRNVEKAADIANAVNAFCKREIAEADSIGAAQEVGAKHFGGGDYIAVQCTSVGLEPNEEDCVIEDGPFFDHVIAGVDLIYKPATTKFMKLCDAHGKESYNGLYMLLFQGIAAYELFTNVKISDGVIRKTARKLEQAVQTKVPGRHIVLVGYMGSGKSRISKELGRIMGYDVVDTDGMIEDEQGMSVSDIFAKYGEAAFRDMETELLEKIAEWTDPVILSTGGGMPVREENRALLKKCGTVFYLETSPEVIYERVKDDTSRPLLQCADPKAKIAEMMEVRGPIYRGAADETVVTDNREPRYIALEILQRGGYTK